MDLFASLEIYIPVEAEVKSIALKSLPNSVVRRMSLPLFDTDGSRMDTDSQEGIWICPAVLRKKGQRPASHAGNGTMENISSLIDREFRSPRGPLRISFVSSNRTAYRVLKDTLPGKKVSAHTPHSSLLPTGSAPRTYQDAVIIYRGCIYLSIRKPRESKSQRKKCEPQPSDMSSKSQEELLNDNSPKKKHTTCKVPHSENRKDATHKGRDVSSPKTALSLPQSTDSVHNLLSHCSKVTREEQAAEEAASPEPEQSSNQSWTRRESEVAACVSTSLQQEVDFTELAHEEKIAQMKAKLRQSEAFLNNLPSSK
ncbi:uncharacterized protein LOC143327663 isoform X2 [Chaetodon auriga]|uniref:uncharacterized protein LOC143327663 isoform X2 n=1 Tax=Chaetodon auriga TaxID=39042 RepID=UPI00403302D1